MIFRIKERFDDDFYFTVQRWYPRSKRKQIVVLGITIQKEKSIPGYWSTEDSSYVPSVGIYSEHHEYRFANYEDARRYIEMMKGG